MGLRVTTSVRGCQAPQVFFLQHPSQGPPLLETHPGALAEAAEHRSKQVTEAADRDKGKRRMRWQEESGVSCRNGGHRLEARLAQVSLVLTVGHRGLDRMVQLFCVRTGMSGGPQTLTTL